MKSPSLSSLDRRLRARYKVRVPFVLRSDSQETQGMTRNVSLLGISAYSVKAIDQVKPVQCLITLPSSAQPLLANGTVIRCEPLPHSHADGSHEIGVFFREFEGNGESNLARFLEEVQHTEENAIRAGYKALKQRLALRRRKKQMEEKRKRQRKLLRLRRKQARLAKKRRMAKRRGRPARKAGSKRSSTP